MIFALIGKIGGSILVTLLILALVLVVSAAIWGFALMILLHILFAAGLISAKWALGYGTCFLIGIPMAVLLG